MPTITAIFRITPYDSLTPGDNQIRLPIGNDKETRVHLTIFLTEQLADGEDLENLQIEKSENNWTATYQFDGKAQTLTFTRQ